MKSSETPGSSVKRSRRRDGLKTRIQLLEAAGHVFAERGYSDATSKEICALAGTNVAAVNYYFGSRDKLYEEVLVAAHKQLINIDDLEEISASEGSPRDKLILLMGKLIHTARTASRLWGVRVVLRELASPSPFAFKVLVPTVLPKINLARQLVAEELGLPADAPEAQRALSFVILPLLSMILFPGRLRHQVLPETSLQGPGLQNDMIRYVLAGLDALKK